MALAVKLVPKLSKALCFLLTDFFSVFTFFVLFELFSCAESELFDPPKRPENIDPKLFEPSLKSSETSIVKSGDSDKSLNIFSNCLDIFSMSLSDKLACFAKASKGLIPFFLAHS